MGDVLGISFALAAGHALMACASLKSLAHEGIILLFKKSDGASARRRARRAQTASGDSPPPATRAVPLPEAIDSSARPLVREWI
jgi:hypothetical protein